MELDKSQGIWYLDKKDTYDALNEIYECGYLDDVAYHLYLENILFGETYFNQITLLKNPRTFSDYYDKALQIVRNEKLKKITNGF